MRVVLTEETQKMSTMENIQALSGGGQIWAMLKAHFCQAPNKK